MTWILHYLHWLVYATMFISFVYVIFGSVKSATYRLALFALSILLLTQAVRGGCILTDVENIFRQREGYAKIENKFLFGKMPASETTGRIAVGVWGLYYLIYSYKLERSLYASKKRERTED